MSEFKPYSVPVVFNDNEILPVNTIFFRKRNDISVTECARYCVTENAFECESFTYDYRTEICKWSSIIFDEEQLNSTASPFLIPSPQAISALYIRKFYPFHHLTWIL
jgi:hypothetical protein